MFYKSPDNKLHEIDEAHKNFLPEGSVEISEEEYLNLLPPQHVSSPEYIKSLREAAYRAEADPLFFKSERDEATKQEWLDKIADIRARYPQ